MKDGSAVEFIFLGVIDEPQTHSRLVSKEDGMEMRYRGPEWFGDGNGWVIVTKDGKETARYNTRFLTAIGWEAPHGHD